MASILLIDPNPATRSVLKTLLAESGHEVEGVGSLIAARGVIGRNPPAWLLVDLGHTRAAEMLKGIGMLQTSSGLSTILIAPTEMLADLQRSGVAKPNALVDKGLAEEALVSQVRKVVGEAPKARVTPPPQSPMIPEVARAKPRTEDVEQNSVRHLYEGLGVDFRPQHRLLLYCDLQRLYDATAGLTPREQDDVHAALMGNMNKPILSYEGRMCFSSRNGFGAMFDAPARGEESSAGAFSAAIELVYIAQQFCGWLRHRFPGRGRQDFAVCIALDCVDIDTDEIDLRAPDSELKQAILRLASYTALGGQRGWSLTSTQAAIDASCDTCGAGEGLMIRTEEGQQREIFEVAAFALNSTTSVHERIGRILQANSSLLRVAVAPLDHRSLDGSTSKRNALAVSRGAARTGGASLTGEHSKGVVPQADATGAAVIAEGVMVAGYRVVRHLGKGGMAEVFLASHEAGGEERVLKMLPINDGEEEQLQRFIQEYALISQIQDTNVARIYEQGFTQSHAFIAMEYLPGGELRDAMKRKLPIDQVIDWAVAIARALGAVHAKGIAHRDLKPSNLMLRADGTLVLADFGIAKGQSELLNRTVNGHIVGSPYYLSPEQAESKPVDARCDLYSLGVIMFEMLTGKKPFRASNLSDLIRMHVVAPIPRLPEEFSRFQSLIDHLLAKRPSERIANATLVAKALEDLRQPLERTDVHNEFLGHASPQPDAVPLQDVYTVAVIGFDETEKIVLSSTLGLSVRRTPKFVEFAGVPGERPDIYLVDARDLLYLQTMLASNLDRAVPTVLIGTSDFGTRWPVIKRPLQWTKIFEAFDRVLREQEAQAH